MNKCEPKSGSLAEGYFVNCFEHFIDTNQFILN
ncbi:rCG41103 [Rattus norvegicus]|uniref:RCG41103 n=1 Tax=Rattus norvegicus TaxID=10116 RepID=A6K222_RAT|nr:rCG41103 [Rattus norvegicus]